MPEHIPGTNVVKLLEDEFAEAVDGERIEGPQSVRVHEFGLDVVQIQGSKRIGPKQTEMAKWEVSATTLEDFLTKVKKTS